MSSVWADELKSRLSPCRVFCDLAQAEHIAPTTMPRGLSEVPYARAQAARRGAFRKVLSRARENRDEIIDWERRSFFVPLLQEPMSPWPPTSTTLRREEKSSNDPADFNIACSKD
jgi:hypothetical protein